MASQTRSAREEPREWEYYEGLDDVHDEHDQALWCETFREGSSDMELCGGCGMPTGVHLTLGEWVEHPVVCKYCLLDNGTT